MSTGPAHILLVEDNAGDARLLRELLTETGAGRLTLTHVDRLDAAIEAARIDGLKELAIFWRIYVPTMKSTLGHSGSVPSGAP